MGYASVLNARPSWEDRFRQPTLDELREAYAPNPQAGKLFETARERLLGYPDVTETIEWQGLPWRWTIVYGLQGDPTRALTYLVPDPAGPKVAVPLTGEMIDAMPLRRMKKHIRDGLSTGRRVGGTIWACFDIGGKQQLDEVLDLPKRKVKYITQQVAAVAS
ncbi:MAG: hypothetical protein KDA20_06240 [Phycisphaerales bacterium]|nr:hypothetical protein [Phycisphaerales bacterium]